MLSGHRSAGRRRNSRAARIAVPLAIPMALGLTLGIILAVSGNNTTTVEQSALGSCASAAASAPAPAASGSQAAPAPAASGPAAGASAPASAAAAPSPCPSASGSAALRAPVARAVRAFLPSIPRAVPAWPDRMRWTRPGTRSASPRRRPGGGLHQLHIIVPANPLSAQGLATPYQLRAERLHLGCNMAGPRACSSRPPILTPHRGAVGLQPPGHQPGDHPGRRADGADDAQGRSVTSTSGSTART